MREETDNAPAGPAGALDGLRVVDLSQFAAGPTVAMVLGDLGADVVRVDPPGGPLWGHPANALLQRGKRSIVLDLHDHGDRAVARGLAARADVVVESFRPGDADRFGLGPGATLAANPRLVHCSMPGFAGDDPRAWMGGWEAIILAATGIVPVTPGSPGDRHFQAHTLASAVAAPQAAHSILAALIARERTGRGQHVEVPLFDAAFELLVDAGRQVDGEAPAARDQTAEAPHVGHYRGADGRWIQLSLAEPRHLEWFGRAFFPPDWIADGMLEVGRLCGDPAARAKARARFASLIARKPAAEWERLVNERCGAPAGLAQTTREWLYDDDHARASRAVIELTDPELGATAQAGYPVGLSVTPPAARGPRHVLDGDRAAILAELATDPPTPPPVPTEGDPLVDLASALEGVVVVDLSAVVAGPTAARILAEYGADVVKVDRPGAARAAGPDPADSGKRSIRLDLGTDEGRDLVWLLLADADIVHESSTPGVLDRLGFGEEAVRARRPDIVYSSVSAFGPAGYRSGWRGREETAQAVTGIQARWSGPDTPRAAVYPVAAVGAANWSAFAQLVALYHRMRTGVGQAAHASLAQAATFHQIGFVVGFAGRVWAEPAGSGARGWSAGDRLYAGRDRWFHVSAYGHALSKRLAAVEGLEDVDLEAGDEGLGPALEAVFAAEPAQLWVERLWAAGVPAHVVATTDEVMEDERARARGLSLRRPLPDGRSLRTVGPAARLSATPVRPGALAGPPGSDAAAVLARIGRSGDYEDLVARGVVQPGPPDR